MDATVLNDPLLNWYHQHKRVMPWRDAPSPYRTWISEIMLQQTQVNTVIPYFDRFISRFPTLSELAKANLQDVLKLWEGLGYYSRARNLHKAAQKIVKEYNGTLPSNYEELQKIPGIGPYVAAAITSIAFNHPIPVVDGNVLRVFTRYWGISDDIRSPKVRDELFKCLTPYIKKSKPEDFNQAIMELGALVCTPKNPECSQCPISSRCVAIKENRITKLPFKSKKAPVPHYHIAVGVIWQNNKVLIGKRKETQMLGGLWEFPGGKQKENESLEDTVHREVKEETGLHISINLPYCTVKHAYTHFKITLTAFQCHVRQGEATANSTDEIKWVKLDELDRYPFPTANKK